MTYEYGLTEADFRAFRRHVRYRHYKLHWYYAGLAALILCLVWYGGNEGETPLQKLYVLLGGLIVFGGYAIAASVIFALYRRVTKRRFTGPTGRHVLVVSGDGIRETSEHGAAEVNLNAIRAVDETPHHFFVITSGGVGYILPKRGYTDFAALDQLRRNSRKNGG